MTSTPAVLTDMFIFEPEFGWGEPNEPGPQTEDSIERGFRGPEAVDHELGCSDGVDPDNVGDIADEGTGHRG